MVNGFCDRALDPAQRTELAIAIRAVPGVAAVTTSGIVPGGGRFAIGKMHRAGPTGEPPMIVQGMVGDAFFATYRARLLAGRLFDPARFALDIGNGDKDPPARVANVILNRTAVRRLGFARAAEAIDQVVARDGGAVMIVEVVDDMRFGTPRDPVDALAYT